MSDELFAISVILTFVIIVKIIDFIEHRFNNRTRDKELAIQLKKHEWPKSDSLPDKKLK